ncbi:MAG: YhfX family PLP-dependent enzyme [Acidimicrobiia bacterium]|nr:YhfX family PLP-dependent enzyme [Acidimicrobiia bacterium]MYC43985.1 YhfX family PLP-dependent enzyme [Acidimicrobiia bacterium]MYI19373.1 YhfX family PLP-dependent enzyme [Acidimicrobiia bacterium]
MFLDVLRRRNLPFLEAVVALHRAGEIPAGSYVLDLDAIAANSAAFCAEAHQRELTVFAMTKQVGRAPGALDAMAAGGSDGFVAVDMACARAIVANGHRLGHLGHLVQVPRAATGEAASLEPEFWTVFSAGKAAEAAAAAIAAGRTQDLLVRVCAAGDEFYPGHEGGVPLDELGAFIDRLGEEPGVRFAGLTTFPALLFDPDTGGARTTRNVETLARAAELARRRLGPDAAVAINAPGTTSIAVLDQLADAGATQVEPGHGLTGTTPLHATADLPERPAICYLSEVSHLHGGVPLCFGGGFYVDPVFAPYSPKALIAADPTDLGEAPVGMDFPDPAGIDYYARLHPRPGRQVREGDAVICGFRAQAFVTRAAVVGLSGVAAGTPAVAGCWDTLGRPLQRRIS